MILKLAQQDRTLPQVLNGTCHSYQPATIPNTKDTETFVKFLTPRRSVTKFHSGFSLWMKIWDQSKNTSH